MSAPAPSRSSGNITLSCGLLSIPLSVYTGTEEDGISRSEYALVDGEYLKVGRQSIIKDSKVPVALDEVVKFYETQYGMVPLSDAEISEAVGLSNGKAEIVAFHPLVLLNAGAYMPEGILQVRPARRGSGRSRTTDEGAEKAFTVLLTAMWVEGTFALVRLCLRGREQYAALLANGRMLTLRFDSEVRADLPLPQVEATTDEVAMGRMLVATMLTTDRVDLTNTSAERVRAYAESKVLGDSPVEVATPDTSGAVSDLMASLKASIEAARTEREGVTA
jgi:non-homologous end joining protein Ku